MLHVLVDDLLLGETQGYPVTDCSRRVGDPMREFYVRVVLLYVCGDYPALAKASGFAHAGGYECHYCHDDSPSINGRPTHGCFCRWLPQGDALRADARLKRQHDKYVAQGRGDKPTMRTKFTVRRDALHPVDTPASRGVKFLTPFDLLDKFDTVWDFCLDMMHVLNALFNHMVPLLKGERPLQAPHLQRMYVDNKSGVRVYYDVADQARRRAKNHGKTADYQEASAVQFMDNLCIIYA